LPKGGKTLQANEVGRVSTQTKNGEFAIYGCRFSKNQLFTLFKTSRSGTVPFVTDLNGSYTAFSVDTGPQSVLQVWKITSGKRLTSQLTPAGTFVEGLLVNSKGKVGWIQGTDGASTFEVHSFDSSGAHTLDTGLQDTDTDSIGLSSGGQFLYWTKNGVPAFAPLS
jgi:hypothetical protein